jgi:hypothetical protein
MSNELIDKLIIETDGSNAEQQALIKKLLRLQEISKKLWIPVPVGIVTYKVENPNQPPIQHKQISMSWTRNMYNWMMMHIGFVNLDDATFGSGKFSFKDTSGTVKSSTTPAFTLTSQTLNGLYCATGLTTSGIVVGIGTGAESFNSYILGSICTTGTGVNQFSYNACGLDSLTWVGSPTFTWTASWKRILNNNSGNTIVVTESGLILQIYAGHQYAGPAYYYYILINRDLLASAENVLDAGQLTVTYDIVITFPE